MRRARITQAVPTPSRMSPLAWWHRGAPGRWSGVRGRAHQEGYSAGSWRCSPAWTTYVPLDHLRAVGPLKCRWTTWFTKYGGPTERKWSNRTQVVQAGRPRHDMRDAVPPCETTGGAEQVRDAGTAPPPEPSGSRVPTARASRTAPDDRPADPAAPDSPNTPGDDSNGSSRLAPLPRAPCPSSPRTPS